MMGRFPNLLSRLSGVAQSSSPDSVFDAFISLVLRADRLSFSGSPRFQPRLRLRVLTATRLLPFFLRQPPVPACSQAAPFSWFSAFGSGLRSTQSVPGLFRTHNPAAALGSSSSLRRISCPGSAHRSSVHKRRSCRAVRQGQSDKLLCTPVQYRARNEM